MSFGFVDFINVIGSLAFFIYGMKVMSEGVQKAAGSQLRNLLRNMTRNRYFGVITGFLTTASVQSSSATTVMTVSFVNAGLITLVESAGIMMGANVGTTITAWIVSLVGKVNLSALSLPLLAIGLPMMYSYRGKLRYWGEFIIGFALLFLGLSLLKESVPTIQENNEVILWLTELSRHGLFSRLLFVLVGAILTVIIQSSSAAMALTITLSMQGLLPLEVALALVLGENIGTTVTAEIASLVGNIHARRSARIHSLFNLIGVIWMILLMPYFLKLLIVIIQFVGIIEGSPFDDPYHMPMTIAAFHTAFNVTNVILLIGFVPWLVRMAIRMVPQKEEEDEFYQLEFINSVVTTSELSIVELQKATYNYASIVSKINRFTRNLINSSEEKVQRRMLKKIEKYEELTDNLENEIVKYLTKVSEGDHPASTTVRLRSFLNICNDLERIGDVYFQISKTFERKTEQDAWWNQEQRDSLNRMLDLIDKAFLEMQAVLETPDYKSIDLFKAIEIEDEINQLRNQLRDEGIKQISKKSFDVKGVMAHNNVISLLEKVGDHIINVNEAASGKT